MSLTARPSLAALVLGLVLSTEPALTCAAPGPTPAPHPRHHVPRHLPESTDERLGLYSEHLKRATVEYLKLRILQLREEGLDRARLAIEHKISIDDMLRSPQSAPPH